MKHLAPVLGALLAATVSAAATAAPPSPVLPSGSVDYGNPAAWICRPGRQDACSSHLDATVISADGRARLQPFRADPRAKADCFYVYGTVSLDAQGASDMVAGQNEEVAAVREQAAPLGQACRVFAPIYRQNTMAAFLGRAPKADHKVTLGDVRAAFAHYLANDNGGRGYVLIGHSQGGSLVRELVQADIDGKPAQRRLLSAVIMGSALSVPRGRNVGGDFSHVPLCSSASETGCVIPFHAYRASTPEGHGGMTKEVAPGMEIACVNPAILNQPGDETLHPYLPTVVRIVGAGPAPPWTALQAGIATPFVALPGLLSSRCETRGAISYLAISVRAGRDDLRAKDIPGDVYVGGKLAPKWGLHGIEPGLTLGDIAGIVRKQSAAFASRPMRNVR